MRTTIALICIMSVAAVCPAAPPATQPHSTTLEAWALLLHVRDAYAKLTSLELAGTISARLDVGAGPQTQTAAFTANYTAPDKFRAEIPDDLLLGCTGSLIYAWRPSDNSYLSKERTAGKLSLDEMPEPIGATLRQQYPSLVLALSGDAAAALTKRPEKVERGPDVNVGPTACPCLLLHYAQVQIRAVFDPRTYLLRQWIVDRTAELNAQRGLGDVKAAVLTYDYTLSDSAAPPKPPQFAWTPPPGARDLGPAEAREMITTAAEGPAGKPAPDFALDDLDGKTVKLSEQAGSVVVLHFWATWYGPSAKSLPVLEKLYQEKKDAGLKVFIVNLHELPADVKRYVAHLGLTMPVLLDTPQTSVAEKFGVTGASQTVVIAKDGTIAQILVDFAPDTDQKLRAAVDKAMKSDK